MLQPLSSQVGEAKARSFFWIDLPRPEVIVPSKISLGGRAPPKAFKRPTKEQRTIREMVLESSTDIFQEAFWLELCKIEGKMTFVERLVTAFEEMIGLEHIMASFLFQFANEAYDEAFGRLDEKSREEFRVDDEKVRNEILARHLTEEVLRDAKKKSDAVVIKYYKPSRYQSIIGLDDLIMERLQVAQDKLNQLLQSCSPRQLIELMVFSSAYADVFADLDYGWGLEGTLTNAIILLDHDYRYLGHVYVGRLKEKCSMMGIRISIEELIKRNCQNLGKKGVAVRLVEAVNQWCRKKKAKILKVIQPGWAMPGILRSLGFSEKYKHSLYADSGEPILFASNIDRRTLPKCKEEEGEEEE
jgi:hypothetical protein